MKTREIKKLIVRRWCGTVHDMHMQKAAMCTGAQIFRKTALILVYEETGDPYKLKYCGMCCAQNVYAPETIYIKDGVIYYD